ncbi:hypothetical protein J3E07_001368 [Methanococcus voltae]|uniref:Siphovirus-type tail component C-terminal domain-containing protein n=1 Tax=Methanococcus voltae TaxID=2188 RepID=A0A8J7URL7_METVO|nr:phage tail domain-containing protein [Methanococcus voltae]MBP2201928.1 hypothetical protein [Methanococcus voltae]
MTLYYHKEANNSNITVKIPFVPANSTKYITIEENSEHILYNDPKNTYKYFWKFSDITSLSDWSVESGSKDNAIFSNGIMRLDASNIYIRYVELPESYRLISRFRPEHVYCGISLWKDYGSYVDTISYGDGTSSSDIYQGQYIKLNNSTIASVYNLLNTNWYVQEYKVTDSKIGFYANNEPIFEKSINYDVSVFDKLRIHSTTSGGGSGIIYVDYIAIAEYFENIQITSTIVDNVLKIKVINNNNFDLVNYPLNIDVSELNLSTEGLKILDTDDTKVNIVFNNQQLYTSQDNLQVYAEVSCGMGLKSVKIQNNQYIAQDMVKLDNSKNTYSSNILLSDSINNLKVIATNKEDIVSNSDVKIVNKITPVTEDKPVVTIIKTPPIPEVTSENYVTLQCDISDSDNILYVRGYNNKLKGYIELSKVEGTINRYSCNMPLFYGDNHINIITSDVKNYLGTSETLVITKNDTTAPKIIFDTMCVKCIDEPYRVLAKVYDDESGLKDVKVVHYGNETKIHYMDYVGNGIYEKLINLVDGENRIRIISLDNNGNELISDIKTIIKENKETVNVIRQELTPQLDIIFEKPINKVTDSIYNVECFINTNLQLDGVYIILNGNSIRLDCIGDKKYCKKVKLNEGLNNLYLQVKGQGLTKYTEKYSIYYSLKNTLKYINNDNEIIVFEKNIDYEKLNNNIDTLIFRNIDGLNCSKMNYETKKSNNGIIINNGTLNPYNLKINGLIISKNPELLEKKLTNIFSPTKSGVLYLQYDETYECPCKVCNININSEPDSKTDTVREFSIELIAEKPYWLSSEKSVEFSKGSLGFKYPLRLPINFGRVNNHKMIINSGYVETPLKLEINGPMNTADDCLIANNSTGEHIKLCKKLDIHESLFITTEPINVLYMNKNTGETKKAFDYITMDSKFFNLKTGTNDIELTTSNPDLTLKMTYRFRNLTL